MDMGGVCGGVYIERSVDSLPSGLFISTLWVPEI